MKRWIALLTALCLLVSITALAEDVDLEDAEPTLTPEELEELQELDEVNEEDENVPTNTVGAVYQEKSLSDFDAASPAGLYLQGSGQIQRLHGAAPRNPARFSTTKAP